MQKFSRVYRIDFEIGNLVKVGAYDKPILLDTLSVEYPLTAQFNISRTMSSAVNTAFVQIYGLSPLTREKIYKDRYDVTRYIKMEIYAGYENGMSLVFSGYIKECQSTRKSGATEFITQIDAWDGGLGMYLGEDNNTYPSGTAYQQILSDLSSNMFGVNVGKISDNLPIEKPLRSVTFNGKTYEDLRTYTKDNLFIDNGTINFIDTETEVIDGNIGVISVDSGLLGTPERRNTNIIVEMIFEPSIVLGQELELVSQKLPYLNQTYKVLGVSHDGIISGAKGGSMITRLELFVGTQSFRRV